MGQRPAHVRPPAYLSKSPPVPQSAAPESENPDGTDPQAPERALDPTRYGDWEHKGIAVDF